jgi:hypothetical protein
MYLGSFTKSFEMKSLATLDILSNSSASKSHLAVVTLHNVSGSVAPINGESPDNLKQVYISNLIFDFHIHKLYQIFKLIHRK